MKKKIIKIFVIFIIIFQINTVMVISENTIDFNKGSNQFCNNEDVLTIINQINQSLIENYLTKLVEFGPRFTGTESCTQASNYIFEEFEKLGLDVYFDEYKFFLKWGTIGNKIRKFVNERNIVATLKGTDTKSDAIFILCAHYDTTPDSPGANDDGSGIAAMLAIANTLSNYSFNYSIRFIAFSSEEVGCYGSHDYAKKAYARRENIRAVLNLETFGYTSAEGKELYFLKTPRTEWLSQFSHDIAEKYYENIGLKIVSTDNRPCDHQAFLDYGYDAAQYVQLNRDDYPLHTPEDSLDKINYSYLVNVTKLICSITVELVKKPIDLQIGITTPYEGYIYIMDRPIFKLPGLNTRRYGIRGLTYIFGKAVVRVNITTDLEISKVFFCIDDIADWNGECTEPPYEWRIEKPVWSALRIKGKHTIGVYVITKDGKVAYDEMDIFVRQLF